MFALVHIMKSESKDGKVMANTMFIIDRIEDGIAVIECRATKEIIELPKNTLPKGVREGQLLVKAGDTFTIDHEAIQKRREELKKRLENIFGRGVK